MLIWLTAATTRKWSPNENYAPRDDGALHARRRTAAYTEDDVREQARALTGFRNDWNAGRGPSTSASTRSAHDSGVKTIFGKRGDFDWQDSCRLCVAEPDHPSLLRPEAVELLRPDAARRGDASGARASLRRERLRRSGPSSRRS